MISILEWFRRKSGTGKIAASRLKMVVLHDRVSVTPQYLDLLKGDMLRTINEYMVVDDENMHIELSRKEDGEDMRSVLTINVPILQVKEVGRNVVI